MANAHRLRRHQPLKTVARSRWLEILLMVFGLALVVQLFPSLWGIVLATIDVRGWTWRSWAVASTIWIVCMVVIKSRRDRAADA
jgi:hypothetical protein